MNAARLAQAERALPAALRKVFECVPIADAWTKAQVNGELHRRGTNLAPPMVAGMLDKLKEAGLVREPSPGSFVREAAREPVRLAAVPPANQEQAPAAPMTTTKPEDKRHTLDSLAELSARVRSLATTLAHVANDLDDLAIEVEERIDAAGKDGEKLRALQSLLKSITN